MNNIIWLKPDSTYAVTAVADKVDSVAYAATLQTRGDIAADWKVFSTDTTSFDVFTKAQTNSVLLGQIAQLEASQGRAIREATLAIPNAVDRLTALNNKIVELRKQLIS